MMKLKNKRTGEIVSLEGELTFDDKVILLEHYNSLAKLNEEWEDYKEQKIKKYCWLSPLDCGVVEDDLKWNECEEDDEIDKFNVEIGNYFETKEEAEKAVKKLKAWKRLKDAGFKFIWWDTRSGSDYNGRYEGKFVMFSECDDVASKDDLDLLFGEGGWE